MINDQELLFVVDENNKPLKPLPRRVVHSQGIWHRTSHIWVINVKKELLCQKRSMKVDRYPGFWEPRFGGHLAPDEDYLVGAVKEIGEELGVKVAPKRVVFFKVYKSEEAKEFQGVYILKLDLDLSKMRFEEDEIDELKWLELKRVKEISREKSKGWVQSVYEKEILDWLEKGM